MALKMAIAQMLLHWGYWVRYPLASARQDIYVVPQPSTLVGMFINGLSRALNGLCGLTTPEVAKVNNDYLVPMVKLFLPSIKEVYFRVLKGWGFRVMDITRHFQGPYIRADNLSDPNQWFAVRVVGKLYAPMAHVEASYLMDIDEFDDALRSLGCGAPGEKILLAGLLSMSRIGPIEGIVTVTKALLAPVKETEGKAIKLMEEPCPYFEVKDGSKLAKLGIKATVTQFWNWRSEDFWRGARTPSDALTYVVPLSKSSLDAGVLTLFTPCALLRDIISDVYVAEVDGHEYTYPKPQ
ncbi:MAG: hypothetical protein ACP5NQ_04260 [Vulcanisaeta sp.]